MKWEQRFAARLRMGSVEGVGEVAANRRRERNPKSGVSEKGTRQNQGPKKISPTITCLVCCLYPGGSGDSPQGRAQGPWSAIQSFSFFIIAQGAAWG